MYINVSPVQLLCSEEAQQIYKEQNATKVQQYMVSRARIDCALD